MTYDEKLAFLRRCRDAQRTMRRLQKAGALPGEGWCTDEKRRNDVGRV